MMKLKTNEDFTKELQTKNRNQKNKNWIWHLHRANDKFEICMANMIFKEIKEKSGKRRKKVIDVALPP
jgi:hypothetical protein